MKGVVIEFSKKEEKAIGSVAKFFRKAKILIFIVLSYLQVIGDAFSQLCNAIVAGNASQTIACRAQRNDGRFWRIVKKLLDLFMSPRLRDHCDNAQKRNVARATLILANRGN